MNRVVFNAIQLSLLFMASALTVAKAQTCCQATANCSSCNSGNYSVMCVAPVITGGTGCTCSNKDGTCPCVKCTWSWIVNGNANSQTSTANCSTSNQCKAVSPEPLQRQARGSASRLGRSPFMLMFQSPGRASEPPQDLNGVYNDSQAGVMITEAKPNVVNGTVNGLTANIKNVSSQDIVAFEVQWSLVLEGCRPTATASRDMAFAGGFIPPGGSLEVTSHVGGWPINAVKSISARVSYYQLKDNTEYDSKLTGIGAEFRERRVKTRGLLATVRALSEQSSDADKAISGFFSDPNLAKDSAASIPLLELKGLYNAKGRQALLDLANRALNPGRQ